MLGFGLRVKLPICCPNNHARSQIKHTRTHTHTHSLTHSRTKAPPFNYAGPPSLAFLNTPIHNTLQLSRHLWQSNGPKHQASLNPEHSPTLKLKKFMSNIGPLQSEKVSHILEPVGHYSQDLFLNLGCAGEEWPFLDVEGCLFQASAIRGSVDVQNC